MSRNTVGPTRANKSGDRHIEVEVFIKGRYDIPIHDLQELIDDYRATWGNDAELFPGDLAKLAYDKDVGQLVYEPSDFESHEEPLQPDDLPRGIR